jgi:hypothetical protein
MKERMSVMLTTCEALSRHMKNINTLRLNNDSLLSSKDFKVFSYILSHLSSQHPSKAARRIIIPKFQTGKGKGRTRASIACSANRNQPGKIPDANTQINLNMVPPCSYTHVRVSSHFSAKLVFPLIVRTLVKESSI